MNAALIYFFKSRIKTICLARFYSYHYWKVAA